MPTSCRLDGKIYALGESFKRECNTCTCTLMGIACTMMACPGWLDGGPDAMLVEVPRRPLECTLRSRLTFGHTGGMVRTEDVNTMDSMSFKITRNYLRGGGPDGAFSIVCLPQMPTCGELGVVSVATIIADLDDIDVRVAFASAGSAPALYGTDLRPVDGTVYSVALDEGRALLVGEQCLSPIMSSCRTIPQGLVRLVADLKSLAEAMVAQAACQGL